MYWLNWRYSLSDNFNLCLVDGFDKSVIESEDMF